MSEAPLRKHPDAASRNYDGEAFIVVPGKGEYNILNPIGTRVWDLIDGQRTVVEIARVISDEYAVEQEIAEADVSSFVDDLRKHQMLA
ncbi:MAG: PqqD family protein [Acidobacteria bacterium]|nr:PqqD family protein [Acidobacteriota bacterium]